MFGDVGRRQVSEETTAQVRLPPAQLLRSVTRD